MTDRPGWVAATGALLLGAGIAAGNVAVLTKLSPIWPLLVGIAAVVCIGAFLAKDVYGYWLAVFLVSLPFNLRKNFAAPEVVLTEVQAKGLPWGATTVFLELTDIALVVLMAILCLRAANEKTPLSCPPVFYLAFAFLGWAGLGLLTSAVPALTSYELMRQVKFVLLGLVMFNILRLDRHRGLIITSLLIGLTIQAGVTIARYQFQIEDPVLGEALATNSTRLVSRDTVTGEAEEMQRGEGSFGHSNVTAMHFEFVMPVALAVAVFGASRMSRLLGLGAFLFGLLATTVTFSRAGLVGILVGSVVFIVVGSGRRLLSRKWLGAVAVAAVLLFPVIVAALSTYLGTRPEAFSQRFVHWKLGLEMAQLNPALGVGLNTSTAVRQRADLESISELIDDEFPLHNHYLLGLVETGVVGVLLYLAIFTRLGMLAYRLTGSPDRATAWLALAVFSAYVSIALHMTIDFLSLDPLHSLLWFYAALILALQREAGGQWRARSDSSS